MSDRKSVKHLAKKRNPKGRIVSMRIWSSPTLNTCLFKGSFENSAIASGTTGNISFTSSPSIASSTEYSTLQNLFTEVKLFAWRVYITATQAANGLVNHGQVNIGINMLQNLSVFVNPSGITSVENLTQARVISTLDVRPFIFNIAVPKLEYSSITADAPSPVTPWAGSPGVLQYWSTGLTVSTVYLDSQVQCVWFLRGRQ